ncbi:hypothetical protein [Ornithinimicrobium pekingense]
MRAGAPRPRSGCGRAHHVLGRPAGAHTASSVAT